MTTKTLSPREYHARRDEESRDERESLRLLALTETRAAIRRRAPEFPRIRAVYLFGSVVQPGRFHAASDVDIAVDSEDIAVETPFCRALEADLKRDVDLRPLKGPIARAVEDSGEKVYERKVPAPGA
jgi:predicted nucleotidyltransferase